MGYTEENLWYILDLLNYRYELMREYREGKRDRRFTYEVNQQHLAEMEAEQVRLYQENFVPLARYFGYEYLPFPAIPRWQRARDGNVLWLMSIFNLEDFDFDDY